MPWKARTDAPGTLHHVIVRGIERGKIFQSDYDRKNFLNRLGKLIPETQTDCFAWELMPNGPWEINANQARSLLCIGTHRKLGMITIEIGKRLKINQSAVSRSSMRGQRIEKKSV